MDDEDEWELACRGGSRSIYAFGSDTRILRRYAAFDGLNLTWETLEGVVKHNGPVPEAPPPVAPWRAAVVSPWERPARRSPVEFAVQLLVVVLLLAVVLQVLVGLLQLWVVQFAPWLLLAVAVLLVSRVWGARRGW